MFVFGALILICVAMARKEDIAEMRAKLKPWGIVFDVLTFAALVAWSLCPG